MKEEEKEEDDDEISRKLIKDKESKKINRENYWRWTKEHQSTNNKNKR